jgi:hypothetical protein
MQIVCAMYDIVALLCSGAEVKSFQNNLQRQQLDASSLPVIFIQVSVGNSKSKVQDKSIIHSHKVVSYVFWTNGGVTDKDNQTVEEEYVDVLGTVYSI